MYLICYDIAEQKIRNRLVKFLESFSWRVQESVFLCESIPMKEQELEASLLALTRRSSRRKLLIAALDGRREGLWMKGSDEEGRRSVCI